MKKFLVVSAIGLLALFYNSCSKDKTPAPPDCIQADSINTYTISVKPILDTHCATAGCHDAVTAFSGVRLDTYENAVDAAKNQPKFFCVIDHSCTPQMPYLLPKLADPLITKIQAWKTNCYAP
jgi:hypothetical protein